MRQTADVVIVGAGVIGMSVAMQIARRSALRIIVVEKGEAPGEGSTGASSAVCRFKYTRNEMVALARDGIAAYKNWGAFLRLPDPVAQFQKHGALWLHSGTPEEVDRLKSLNVRAEQLDGKSVGERYPAINTCLLGPDEDAERPHTCVGGDNHLLEVDAGYMDPMDTLQDLMRAARVAGVTIKFQMQVTAIERRGGAIVGVTLNGGEQIDAPVVVNAAGPWCLRIFQLAGIECPWPLVPTRIQVAHVARPQTVEGHIPVCVDPPGGLYFRTQNRGQQIVVGSVLEEDEREGVDNPDSFNRLADDDFVAAKLDALQHRIRGLSELRQVRGYCGLYTTNRTDVHPVVGETSLKGFYAANGCSGHGFKLAPAIGSLIARNLIGAAPDFDAAVDPSFLAFDRTPIAVKSLSVLA